MTDYASSLNSIPVNPGIAAKVLTMAQNQEFSFASLEEVIMADPGLTAKILKIANSALYARQSKVTKLQTAMTIMGVNTIKNLVILVTGSSLVRERKPSRFYPVFWSHSLASAFLARDLARRVGLPHLSEEAFVAGLLHDIGQVALYLHDPAKYSALMEEATAKGIRTGDLERREYDTTHREVGRDVLSRWSFPQLYADTALEHGNANIASPWKQGIVLVSVADCVASNWNLRSDLPRDFGCIAPYLSYLGLPPSDFDAFQAECKGRLEQDKLYKECQALVTV